MKISRSFSKLLTAFLLGFGPVTGYSEIETYYYSGSVSGYTEVDLTPEGFGVGGLDATFGALTETVYYDPVAQTLQTVGSVTVIVNPSSGSFNIRSMPPFPEESGSATLTVGNNGSFSFNTAFALHGSDLSGDLLVPVSGSGIYNGQAFTGNWNIDIPLAFHIISDSPTSLAFSESAWEGGSHGQNVVPETDLEDGTGDGTYYYSWQLTDAVATAVPDPATPVPEPATPAMNLMLLIPFGASAFRQLREKLRTS